LLGRLLRQQGHDVIWSVEWDSDPGDEEILSRARSGQQGPVCREVLERYGAELRKGAIVTAGLSRVRIRPTEEA